MTGHTIEKGWCPIPRIIDKGAHLLTGLSEMQNRAANTVAMQASSPSGLNSEQDQGFGALGRIAFPVKNYAPAAAQVDPFGKSGELAARLQVGAAQATPPPSAVPAPVINQYGLEGSASRRARYTAEAMQRLPAAQAQLEAAALANPGKPHAPQPAQQLPWTSPTSGPVSAQEMARKAAIEKIQQRRALRQQPRGMQTQAGIDSMRASAEANNDAYAEAAQLREKLQSKEQEHAYRTQERVAAQEFQAEQKRLDREARRTAKPPKIASPAEAAAMIPLHKKPEDWDAAGQGRRPRPPYGWSDDQTPEERMQQIRDGQKAHAKLMQESGANPYTERDQPPQIASDDEYDALPSGTTYIDPDGIMRMKQ